MGAGFHGGFGNTKGVVPISKSSDLRYDRKKMTEYLLNLNHPQGGSKAKFLRDVLGYTSVDGKILHDKVASALIGEKPTQTVKTKFGTKHTFHISLTGKDGNAVSANVVVVIQKNNGRTTYRIVTLYPDKKGG